MDLNKVLDKELDAWLVVGKEYEIGADKDDPESEPIIAKYNGKSFNKFYCFKADRGCVFKFCIAGHLAKVGIKEVEELKVLTYRESREIVDAYVKTSKELWKQKVLEEVEKLINKFKDLYRSSDGVARWQSFELSEKLTKELKEKINGL